ncbi:MAG: cobalamin-binding protein [Bacillota bacterium]|nr:cobalamin-binding protein [Bacillota bacterium]
MNEPKRSTTREGGAAALPGRLLLLLLLLCGAALRAGAPAAQAGAAATFPLAVTDDWGRRVVLPAPPQRIVSLAPSNTELLFALGLGPRVVGVTTWCNYPPEAQKREKVGDVRVNEEKVVALRPDLVVADGNLQPEAARRLEALGLPVLVVAPRDLAGVFRALELLGRAGGREREARELATHLRARVERVQARVEALKRGRHTPPLRVLVLVDPDHLYAAGPGTFLDELVRLAGGTNVAAQAGVPWPQLSEEEIIRGDPEVILVTGGSREAVLRRRSWRYLAAVRTGRIYELDPDRFSRSGPRLVDALEELVEVLYGREGGRK